MSRKKKHPGWGGAREGSGRPKLPASRKIRSVTVAMPGALADQLDAEARRLRVGRSKLAVAILKRALATRERNREAAAG